MTNACQIARDHVERTRVAALGRHSMGTLAKWLTQNTTLGGLPFTFLDHEYQEPIVSDTSLEISVQKPSQVGLTECTVRLCLAMVNVISPITVIYTLPTAKMGVKFAKTRFDPVIEGSSVMKGAIHPTNDTTDVKQFGDSFLYINGAASSNAAISIPGDVIVSDETDFSDQEILSQYESRLTHSKWKLKRKFSTPTLPGFGVNKSFMESRRHYNLCKCCHCGHWFRPHYYDHVRIPGFTGDLREITKHKLSLVRWEEAFLACPKCAKPADLGVEYRELVCENPEEKLVGAGYQVTPFDAPNIISIPDLIKSSTSYVRLQDFYNFGLGLPLDDVEATLTRADIEAILCQDYSGSNTVHVMGVDTGSIYRFVVGAVDGFGDLLAVHIEEVPMGKAKERYWALRAQYRVICTVMDSAPHAETVLSLQAEDPTLYAAVYMKSKSILTHSVVDKPAEKEEGTTFHRQVNVNRSKAFDGYMAFLRENHMRVRKHDDHELMEAFITQHLSMKRAKTFDPESQELVFTWQKSDGNDHFHHTGLYCWIAAQIRGVVSGGTSMSLLGMSSFVVKTRAA